MCRHPIERESMQISRTPKKCFFESIRINPAKQTHIYMFPNNCTYPYQTPYKVGHICKAGVFRGLKGASMSTDILLY